MKPPLRMFSGGGAAFWLLHFRGASPRPCAVSLRARRRRARASRLRRALYRCFARGPAYKSFCPLSGGIKKTAGGLRFLRFFSGCARLYRARGKSP